MRTHPIRDANAGYMLGLRLSAGTCDAVTQGDLDVAATPGRSRFMRKGRIRGFAEGDAHSWCDSYRYASICVR